MREIVHVLYEPRPAVGAANYEHEENFTYLL